MVGTVSKNLEQISLYIKELTMYALKSFNKFVALRKMLFHS